MGFEKLMLQLWKDELERQDIGGKKEILEKGSVGIREGSLIIFRFFKLN